MYGRKKIKADATFQIKKADALFCESSVIKLIIVSRHIVFQNLAILFK